MKHILSILAALLAAASLAAQTDSVLVFGSVTNFPMGTPMPGCTVYLLRDGDTVATALSDAEGFFYIKEVPAGSYTLSVEREFSLYMANLVLAENAELGIAVDTIQHVNLQPVQVTGYRHMLGELLVTSPDDPGLWNISGHSVGAPASQSGRTDGKLNHMENFIKRKFFYHRKGYPLIQDYFPDVVKPAPKKKGE